MFFLSCSSFFIVFPLLFIMFPCFFCYVDLASCCFKKSSVVFCTGMHEIDKIEYSRGHSHIGTCWIQNCWQSPSRICLTSFHSSTLLLHNFISSFKVFCTGMHEIDKIEYSRGCSVSFCEYSILIFYLVVFFSSGRPMVIFSLACLVVKNILSFRRSVYFFTVATICIFAETMSPFFFNFRRDHVANVCLIILGIHRRNIIIFLDVQHAGHTLWILVKTPFGNIGCSTSFSRSTTRGSLVNLTI